VAVVAGGADDDGDSPARALLTPAPGERDAGDDLRPLRQDDVRLGHGSAPLPVGAAVGAAVEAEDGHLGGRPGPLVGRADGAERDVVAVAAGHATRPTLEL